MSFYGSVLSPEFRGSSTIFVICPMHRTYGNWRELWRGNFDPFFSSVFITADLSGVGRNYTANVQDFSVLTGTIVLYCAGLLVYIYT
jgi:hypothetical protein